jgi:HNH endonuclease
MGLCALCEATITAENYSQEHLIPNALGGRRKVSGLLCRDCNSATGESWEAELAKQLLPLCLLLNISRERGDPPGLRVETSAGERLTIGPNGTLTPSAPVFTRTPSPSGKTHYHVKARTMDEARQIITDLKRKHPEIDVEATLAEAQMVETYPQGAVGHDLSIGGELAGRSMVKSSLSWAFANGVDWAACEGALGYLRAKGAPPCFGYYHDTDLIQGRPAGVPLHCLSVEADAETGLILGYGEYFGFHRFVCLLGEGYRGPSIRSTYAIDPRTGAGLDLHVHIPFSRCDIEGIYDYKRTKLEDLKRAADAILSPAMQAHMDAERNRVVSQAIDAAFSSCGAKRGDELTAEQIRKLALVAAQKVTPFVLHQMKDLPPDVVAAIRSGAVPPKPVRRSD